RLPRGAYQARLDITETGRDEEDDLVEVGVVVQTSDPRPIGRACIGGERKGQHGGDQTEAHESLQNDLAGHHGGSRDPHGIPPCLAGGSPRGPWSESVFVYTRSAFIEIA